jgi:hypothetical protein
MTTLDEQVRINMEIKRKEAEYDREEAASKEQKRVEAVQAALDEYLTRRADAYVEAAGTTPSPATLEAWTVEYANEREGRRQEKNQRTIQQSEVF